MYKLCDNKDDDEDSDEYALGLHLFTNHNLNIREDFDENYNVALLDFCSPKSNRVRPFILTYMGTTLS